MGLRDNCGRPLFNLRISITKRCNRRCEYCHLEGEAPQNGLEKEMIVEEIVRIARIAISLGISRVKITGGEPLIREDVAAIVRGVGALPGLADLSMTTNAARLAPLAEELHAGGLKRVNVTLPSLNREVYRRLTGGDLEPVLDGIEAAVKAGFNPVKLNMLILKGMSDDSVQKMIRFAAETGAILQMIELEPLNISDAYYSRHHKSLDEYEEMLKQNACKVETRQYMQNRHIYHLPNVRVETVRPTESAEFCRHCTRLRVTSEGQLKPCLMTNDNLIDILTPMREGASDEELVKLFVAANLKRQPYNVR